MILGIEEKELVYRNACYTANEINQQPDVWKKVVDSIKENKEKIIQFSNKTLHRNHIRIILCGAGTSAFAGEVCAPYLSELLGFNVEFIATTDIVASPSKFLHKSTPTILISFARSGNSPESVATVNLAKSMIDELYQIVITCNENGALSKQESLEKNLVLLMPEETNDLGFAMTSSLTSMILGCIAVFNIDRIDSFENDVEKLSNSVRKFIDDKAYDIAKLSEIDMERVIYLGCSSSKGMARESSLKLLELTAGKVNSNYDTPLGFRHGPKSVINDKTTTVFYLSNDEYSRLYDIDLIKEMSSQRKEDKIVLVGCNITSDLEELSDYSLELDYVDYEISSEIFLSLQQIIFGQILGFYKSLNLGLTPDNPCPTGEVNRVVKGVIIHKY